MIETTHTNHRTLADWLTTDRLLAMDAERLYVHDGLSYWLVGKRIVTDSDYSLEIERFANEADAEARFYAMATPDVETDAIIYDVRSGGYSLHCGDWASDDSAQGANCATLRDAAQAYEEAAERNGVYPGLWFDFSYGRGSGWALVDPDGNAVPESEYLIYV